METLFEYIKSYAAWVPDEKSTEFLLAVWQEACEEYNGIHGTSYDIYDDLGALITYINGDSP